MTKKTRMDKNAFDRTVKRFSATVSTRGFNGNLHVGPQCLSVGLCASAITAGDRYLVEIKDIFGRRSAILGLDEANEIAQHLDLLSSIGMGETILESRPRIVTYAITQAELEQLADAISLLDWMRHRLPDECPEKPEAAALAPICHRLIADVLGADQHLVYGKPEPDQEQAA